LYQRLPVKLLTKDISVKR